MPLPTHHKFYNAAFPPILFGNYILWALEFYWLADVVVIFICHKGEQGALDILTDPFMIFLAWLLPGAELISAGNVYDVQIGSQLTWNVECGNIKS